ncbi:MAG: hypothetical protein JWO22_4035 [Frankiales bacterium]|nr:hypothetical protein [Frankiales bacterium]
MILRDLTGEDWPQRRVLGGLTFGYQAAEELPEQTPAIRLGVFDGERLVAVAAGRPYTQWWLGRPVEMCGIAGVAVHPDVRGRGLVRQLMAEITDRTEAPISVLYPTAPGIYRGLGWEVVGTLDETVVPLGSLPTRSLSPTRSATGADLPRLHELYVQRGRSGSGLITREGPSFPQGVDGLLDLDVVTVAEQDGLVTGWVSYSRGQGYRHGGPLRVADCVASTAVAMQSLLAGLASWSAVVDAVRWRGSTADLGLACGAPLPAPEQAQPWMLRVLDVRAGLAARGWGVDGATAFATAGAGWRVTVEAGQATVEQQGADGLPSVDARGLALLFAGRDPGLLLRAGLLDRPAPDLSLFAGPPPEIADYF